MTTPCLRLEHVERSLVIPAQNFQAHPHTQSLMLPIPFTTEDGDVILRVGPDDTFRVHKAILSFTSSVFRDLFRTAQPDQPDGGQEDLLPTIPITDPPQSVDLLLRFIYPGVTPTITNPATLSTLLTIADKYGVPMVPPIVEEMLADEEVLEKDPFAVYVIARRWGLKGVARRAAQRLTLRKVMDSPSSKDPQNTTGEDFFRLLWFMQKRDEEGKWVIRNYFVWNSDPFMGEVPCSNEAHSGRAAVEFYDQLAEKIVEKFEIDPCLDTERMVEIFVNGPDPPSRGFCGDIDSNPIPDEFSVFCPTRPSRIMESLCDLASSLDYDCKLHLGKAMDGEFPV